MNQHFPHTPGEMSDRVRNHDWASTALGPIDTWPIALRMAVEMILGSQFPKCLVWGPELISLYNDAFVPILGDKRASLGQAFSDIWHEAWDNIGPIAERAFAGEATYIENYPLRINRNGQPEDVYFTFCYSPVRDEHGTVVGMLDTVVEMTDKYLVEQQLRDLAASLEKQVLERTADRNRLWTLSTDIMLVCDMANTIIAVNPAWQTVLGWSEEEMIGRDALAFVHPQDLERARHATADLSHGIPLTRFDNRQLHRDGSYRWISWAAVPGDGVINAVGRDITAEREQTEALHQAEELLRHSQKMEAVGQLTGGLAHDFNNLLVGITGSLELLEMRIKQGRVNELDRYLNAAQGAAQRAAALTHRLLAFSRRQTLDPKPTDINRLITGMEELIRRTVGPNIQVEVVGAVGIWTALVDPNQLENSLLNLCINARDAMPHGGRLTIETANKWLDDRAARQRELPAGQYLSLCVTDTGSGMSPDIIKRAFDPFFTTKPTGQGTGLGLSMVYGFARQSGGQVRIYSELGQGTTMCIYLPRHYGEAENDIEVLNSPNVMRGEQDKTVLVIDDEPTVRMLVTEVLSELGYHAVEAGDGAEGLSILQGSEPIDLLISDVGLPGGMNGRQVADAARIIRPALKVLFITGYAENAVVGNGHLEPGMQVLTKPFAMDVLAERIRDLLTD
jgi:PAS domain S-box-containing protein